MLKAFIFGILASLGFALKYELKDPITISSVSFGGGIAWLSYRFLFDITGASEVIAYLVAAIFMSLYAEIMARVQKKPVTIYLIVAMLPLVPGQAIYDTMSLFVLNQPDKALQMGAKAFELSGALALGNLLVATATKFYFNLKSKTLII